MSRVAEGGRVDRARKLGFTFDGRRLEGCEGDTLASALLANGIHLVGRSFKYHRPRGIVSAGVEEPNALMTIDRGGGRVTPNLRATQIALYEGLEARSQNCWPGPGFDLGAAARLFSSLLPAGFYYKTFMWPAGFWKRLYEPAIRAAAGLGRAPAMPDPDRYLHRYAHCEVLVIGAGPAGLAAALAAAASGARVILCDEQNEPGGSLLAAHGTVIDGKQADAWVAEAVAALDAAPNVTLLPRTTAFGWYPDALVGLAERVTDHLAAPDAKLPRERLWQVRAGRVVIATGAHERPLVFPDNDRPGIMLAGAARTYLNRYGVLAGKRIVVATACDSAYAAAWDMQQAGATIAAILDTRPDPPVTGMPVRAATAITGSTGGRRVTGALAGRERIACDAILMSGGWTPSVHLHAQSRGKLRYAAPNFLPDATPAPAVSVGACNGTFDLASCLAEGAASGGTPHVFQVTGGLAPNGTLAGLVPGAGAKHAFVDFQNDVTVADLQLAAREGFRSIEHVKRYTTAGMATDQGKTANLNALAVVADQLGVPVPQVGLTTFRPPYSPVTFGTFAGAARGPLYDPERRTPLHAEAAALGAVFEDAGSWKRALYFPRAGEDMAAAVARECRAVRLAAGIFDASTLGKIEVTGPDAGAFLDRIYTGAMSRLAPGRCRYGLMLAETGFVMDDGVVARLTPDRFHLTTTSGGAAQVLHQMEDYLQTEFTGLKCWLTSVTEQWAVIAVQGPHARDIIAGLVEGIDLATLPHMGVRTGQIGKIPIRLFRVSFTGELGYEINVPAGHAQAVWEAVMRAGAPHGLTPYGTEAMHVLRAEKGYVVMGQETDGTVTPDDLGLSGMIARSKGDFIGRRSLALPALAAPGRRQLVGLLSETVLEEGAQIVADPAQAAPMRMIGHVTSAYHSAALRHPIALALVMDGRTRMGATLHVPMPGGSIPVRVTEPVFYDKAGVRLDG